MSSVYVIAEAGVNHNGSMEMARKLIDAAADAGADAVKFQTFQASKLVTTTAPKADYQRKTTDRGESQFEMLKKLEVAEKDHYGLVEHCAARKIQFLSTPFDSESLDLLVKRVKVPRLKIPSGEITNAPFLLHAARSGVPIILSTGMSTLGEVEQALGVLAFGYTNKDRAPSLRAFIEAYATDEGQKALRKNVTLLHCTSEYPAPFDEVNLCVMDTMKRAFGLPVGYSDHTMGITIPIAAAARGACLIEKHFTLDRSLPGPDQAASLEPHELKAMVESIRQVEKALGGGVKAPATSEWTNRKTVRKSLVAARPIRKGELLDETSFSFKRPGTGMDPLHYWEWIGRAAPRDLAEDELF
jgi:N-acetylneuraminate synthase